MNLFEEKNLLKAGQQFCHALAPDTIYTIYEVINELVYLEKSDTQKLTFYSYSEFCEELQAGVFFEVLEDSSVPHETLTEENINLFLGKVYYLNTSKTFVTITGETDTHLFLSNFTCFEKDEFIELIGSIFTQDLTISFYDSHICREIGLTTYDFRKGRINTNIFEVYIHEQLTPYALFLASSKNSKIKTKFSILNT